MNEKYFRLWRLFMEQLATKALADDHKTCNADRDTLLQVLVDMAKLEGEVTLEE